MDGFGQILEAVGAARAGGAVSLLVIARWVEGPIMVGTCPPITRSGVVVARAGAHGKVGWVWVNGRSPLAWSLGAPVDQRLVWVGRSCLERGVG